MQSSEGYLGALWHIVWTFVHTTSMNRKNISIVPEFPVVLCSRSPCALPQVPTSFDCSIFHVNGLTQYVSLISDFFHLG